MTYTIRSSAIIHEFLDEEIILADLDNGAYYSIRGSGIPIWQAISSGMSPEDLSVILNERYSQNCQPIVESFIQELLNAQLLRTSSLPLETEPPILFFPPLLEVPILEKYDEMKELLMLDPIHEVDEQGWPHKST